MTKQFDKIFLKILFLGIFVRIDGADSNIVFTKRVMPLFSGSRPIFDTFDFQAKNQEEGAEFKNDLKDQASMFWSGISSNVFLNDEQNGLFGNAFVTNSFVEKTYEEIAAIEQILNLYSKNLSAKDKLDSCRQFLDDYRHTIEIFAKNFIQESTIHWKNNLMVPLKTKQTPIFVFASLDATSITKNFYANNQSSIEYKKSLYQLCEKTIESTNKIKKDGFFEKTDLANVLNLNSILVEELKKTLRSDMMLLAGPINLGFLMPVNYSKPWLFETGAFVSLESFILYSSFCSDPDPYLIGGSINQNSNLELVKLSAFLNKPDNANENVTLGSDFFNMALENMIPGRINLGVGYGYISKIGFILNQKHGFIASSRIQTIFYPKVRQDAVFFLVNKNKVLCGRSKTNSYAIISDLYQEVCFKIGRHSKIFIGHTLLFSRTWNHQPIWTNADNQKFPWAKQELLEKINYSNMPAGVATIHFGFDTKLAGQKLDCNLHLGLNIDYTSAFIKKWGLTYKLSMSI